MNVIKSYKYRLYPNSEQQELLNKTFGCVRFYWNNLVESFNSYEKESNPSPEFKTQKELKKEFKWLSEVSAAALQQKKRDFDEAKKQYFNKNRKSLIGRMNFKSKKNKQSYRLPNQKFKIKDSRIRLEKIGFVKMAMDRELPINSKLLSVTVSRNSSGEYYASINFEIEQEVKNKKSKENVGIDLGLKEIATLSNGLQFYNPKVFTKSQCELAKAQRHLSRKKKGSNRYKKQARKVAEIHQSITNRRDWYLHNVSKFIVENFNEIGMEDLHIKGMVKNRRLSKSISDTSMAKLKQFITYKQQEYGMEVKLLNRFEPSTKECSECGHNQTMMLSDRTFVCQNCGVVKDRDWNASIVIRNKTVGVNTVQQTWSDIKTKLHHDVKWQLLRSVETIIE